MLDTSCCREHLHRVLDFARQSGLRSQLADRFRYLGQYATRAGCMYDKTRGMNTQCILYKDFAPYSFRFVMQCKETPDASWEFWFEGGLIYQGPTSPANGGAPSFTVSLAEGSGWFIHT